MTVAIHSAIWEWAFKTPEAIAITDGDYNITYRELAARADALAARLRLAGVGPDMLVGLLAERSADLIIGLVAILRAGAAYVPIDPSYPAERRAFLLADAQCRVVVTQKRSLVAFSSSPHSIIVLDDSDADQLRNAGDAVVSSDASDDPLAYVIYTSGSTGQPKGVLVTHRNVARLFQQTERWYHFGPQDVWPLFHSVAFDFSVWEIWGALIYGGRLVIVPYAVSRDPIAFRRLVREQGVTVLNQTPSAFRLFSRADALESEPRKDALRYIIFGGEALDLRSIRPWFERHGDTMPRLVNMYGITETTVHATYRPLSLRDTNETRSLLGQPIPDLTIHILDPQGNPTTVDQEGEIWVGGSGVSRGYLRRPVLTAERFVRDPFSCDPQARLYRSGDLGRVGSDGELEYLGRIDLQIKIRGFRIELGEIESALRLVPGVADAAVLARSDPEGEPMLVAYVIPCDRDALDLKQVQNHVATQLPDYMCPAVMMLLEAMPLTANGKLDRRGLPVPTATGDSHSWAPLEGTERTIAALFGEILGVDPAECDADFFELGGTSLQAMRLALRIAEHLGVVLPAGTLFRHPSVREVAAAVERLIIEQQNASEPSEETDAEAQGRQQGEWLELSFAQEQIWFAQTLVPESTAFHCPVAFHIRGGLDEARLAHVIDGACMRHPILRTVFEVYDGRPAQRVCAEPTFRLRIEELSSAGASSLQSAAAHAFLTRPFDLTSAAGAALLLRISDQEHVLLLVLHHLVTDGWSLVRLLEEISADYDGRWIQPPGPSFFRLAAEQRRQVEAGELATSEAFWRAELAGAPASSEIAPDVLRRTNPSLRGTILSFSIPQELGAQLEAFGQSEGITPNTLLLTTLLALIHRYSDQRDLVVGIPYAGRDRPGTAATQGALMNLLALRVALPGGVSFRALAREARRRAAAAYGHSGFPLSRVIEGLSLSRDPGRQPLVQIAFAPQPGSRDALSLRGLEVRPLEADAGKSPYAFTLYTWPRDQGFDLQIEYATEMYSRATMERLTRHFVRLAESGVTEPDRPLAELEMLSLEERACILRSWSGEAEATLVRQRPFVPLPAVFWREAAEQPAAEAIRYGAQVVTYKELDEWSNRIAHALRAHGVGRESLVALLCERSPAAIAGILGTWKAGAAYIPLDPVYPEARLAWMMKDSGATFVLTTPYACSLADLEVPRLVLSDAGAASLQTLPSGPVDTVLEPGDLAYVIYTSGSTGVPKGVMVEHRGLASLMATVPSTFALSRGARLLQFSSLSFDACVAELAATFTQGGTMVIPDQRHALAGPELLDLLEIESIAQVILPPSVLAQLPWRLLPDLRLLIVAGEPCSSSLVERWSTGRVFRNAYGPTEASVCASANDCIVGAGDPPIGSPVPGAQLYVLDGADRVVPPLVPGELYIGGCGLARGYLRRPELTRERFVDGVPEVPQRLYRTGDRARWRPDGVLEFLGRTDHQHKLRGFRIELGEVEAALRAHAAIQTCVVLVDGQGANARLIAYIVPRLQQRAASQRTDSQPPLERDAADTLAAELRVHLRSQLPPQMLPSELVILRALPLTHNGKLDRSALPHAAADPVADTGAATALEQLVATAWRDVLSHSVSRTANFFDVGGSSLRLVEVQARLEAKFKVRIPLRALFAHPTIEAMARLIVKGQGSRAETGRNAEERAALARLRPQQERRCP